MTQAEQASTPGYSKFDNSGHAHPPKKTLPITLRLFDRRPTQKLVFNSSARFMIVDAGRRWGKTLTGVNWLTAGAWTLGGDHIWVAPIYKTGMIAWRRLEHAIPKQVRLDTSKSELRMELVSGGVIQVRSGDNPDDLRGEGPRRVVLDEAPRMKRSLWEDVLRPALADKMGRALFIGTPKGRNWFFDLFTRGQDHTQQIYRSWRYPTWDNPLISAEDIEEARKSLPSDVFRQEYEAEFLEDSAGVFRNIRGCTKGALENPLPGKRYYGGLDLARLTDWTVLTLLDQHEHLCHFSRFNRLDWTYQKARIIAEVKAYNNATLLVDSTGVGDPIYEDLRRAGLRVRSLKFTLDVKDDLIQGLAIAFEQSAITIPDIPELINELMIFEYQMTKSGKVTYSAPEGYNDDCVISLALAHKCAKTVATPGFFFAGGRNDKPINA